MFRIRARALHGRTGPSEAAAQVVAITQDGQDELLRLLATGARARLRRGFNHVYGLRFIDGRRAVAHLSAERPRGAPNTY